MPAWPTQADYKDALQNPDTAFRDPDLRASQAERSPMGVPKARSGAFASVYKMTRGPKAVALKLFNFANEDRANRYLAVSDYLKSLGPKRPTAMVGFEYHPEGIRVGKGWYPTLTMEWVKGKSLGEWVREAMEQKKPDTDAVRKMADAWVQLVQGIQDARIAHGDLQHDNVMVVGNVPVLVDYDGMCVPALADPKKPLDQLEFGKPAYQHPGRPADKLGLHLDHFAAWVVLIALRAMVADPPLYTRFVTNTENENLLFSPRDMAEPADSILWPELFKSKDPDVREWAKLARGALDRPFEQVPPFSLDPFATLRKLVVASPRDWAGINAEADRLAKAGKKIPPDLAAQCDPSGRLDELCKAARPDFPAIAAEGEALARAGKTIPDRLKPVVADAAKRVKCRDDVKAALDARNPRAVKAAFQKALLDGWADKRLVADAEAAAGQVAVLDRLVPLARSPGDGRALIKAWRDVGGQVIGLPEADPILTEVSKWEARVAAAERFLKAVTDRAKEQELADAWQAVERVGSHPDLKPDHKARGELAAKRAPVLAKLAAIPAAPAYKNDAALLLAWDPGLMNGCAEAAPYASRIDPARERVAKVAALKKAIDAADAGTGTEAAVVEAARPLAGYDHPHAARAQLGAKSVEALAVLKRAIDEKPPSDRAISAALDALRATNVDLLARLDKLDPALAAEAATAGRRRKALNEFAEIDSRYPSPDEADRRWQATWVKYKDLLHGRRDTEELRDRLTLALNRTKACEAILKALDAREMFNLRELYEKHGPRLRNYAPLVARQDEIEELLGKAERVVGVQKKLGGADAGFTEDDLRFLRENHRAFSQADRDAIVAQVTNKLRTDARLTPGRPPVRVVPTGRSVTISAHWAWAGHGLVSHCLVAVDKARHLNSPTEADQYGLVRCQLRDHTGEGGGKRLAPPPGASKVFVTVWAVVELGWTTVYGPPLHLGPAAVGGR